MSKWDESKWDKHSWAGPFESRRDRYETELRYQYPDLQEAFENFLTVSVKNVVHDKIGLDSVAKKYEQEYILLLKLYWDYDIMPF